MNDSSAGKDDAAKKFHEMGLDDRILKAIAKLGWISPTLIQEKAIPLILEGKDVLVKARTGSGKTGAFALPIIQKILSSETGEGVRALVLAPSKELSRQIYSHFNQLLLKCSQEIRVVDISPQVSVESQRGVLRDPPQIVVGTPARVLLNLKAATFSLSHLQILVIDEADLIFSFGHREDISQLIKELPRVYQAVLASATLTEEVSSLKGLLLQNCVSLKLQEPPLAPVSQLAHYTRYSTDDRDKAFFLYSIFRLSLVQGRSIVFVNCVNKCYKLKLFLSQFSIKSCILNSELPAASRVHALCQFNDGKYDIIITSDETGSSASSSGKKKKSKPKGDFPKDKESGVSRGIDFKDVSNVINFDFPETVASYIHRVGRTARGHAKGNAVSLVTVREKPMLDEVNRYLSEGLSLREPSIFKEFQFNESEVEGLKYRVNNAWGIITGVVIKEVRINEIKQELFNSKRLKHYFKDNPKDLEMLRHDKMSRQRKLPEHVANIPEYLVPPSLRALAQLGGKRPRAKPPLRSAGLVRNKHKKATMEVDDPKKKYTFMFIDPNDISSEAKMANPLSNFDILEQDEPTEMEMNEEPQPKTRRYFNKGNRRN